MIKPLMTFVSNFRIGPILAKISIKTVKTCNFSLPNENEFLLSDQKCQKCIVNVITKAFVLFQLKIME